MSKRSDAAWRKIEGLRGGYARGVLLGCVAAAVLAAASASWAQVERPGPGPEGAAAAQTPEEARKHALERLKNRLEWTRRMLQKFEEAEARMVEAERRIAAGEDPEPIMQELRRKDSPNFRVRISPEDEGHKHAGPASEETRRWHDRRRVEGAEPFPPATPEQKSRVDQMLDTVIPDLSQRLKAICETQPERCEQEYARLAYRMRHIIQDGVADQALFDLRLDEMRVSARVVLAAKRLAGLLEREERIKASGQAMPADLAQEIAESRKTLEALIAEQLDIRSRIRDEERAKLQRERDRIQQQIQQLDDAIVREGQDRARIIARQMEEALGQARGGRGAPADPFGEAPGED